MAALDGSLNDRLQQVVIKTMRIMNKNTSSTQLCGQKMSATKQKYNGTLFSYICCYSWLILFFELGLKSSSKPRAKDLHLRIISRDGSCVKMLMMALFFFITLLFFFRYYVDIEAVSMHSVTASSSELFFFI